MKKAIIVIMMVMNLLAPAIAQARTNDMLVFGDTGYSILQKKGYVKVTLDGKPTVKFAVDAKNAEEVDESHHGVIWMYAINSKTHKWERIDGCFTPLDKESINDKIVMLINDNGLALI